MITPADFVERWKDSALREQQAAQSHFNELCELVGHKTPTQLDPAGEFFTFEEQVHKATGGRGRADVWFNGHFAWEYKGKLRDLDAAYGQLLAYRGGLGNPPLLVVCDFLEYRIYPQWPNSSGVPFVFRNEDLLKSETRRLITWLLESPDKFLELRQTELERRERLTLHLAHQFAELADLLRHHRDEAGNAVWQPLQIARFLTKIVFALFAEDVELMPRPYKQPVFRFLVDAANAHPDTFVPGLQELFAAMNGEKRYYSLQFTPYFNGGLLADSSPGAGDALEIIDLTLIPGGINLLERVSEADWRFVNPTIFGTLFEGALDPTKRAQLGAHYTGESDIRLVIEPVLMQPLYRAWEAVRAEAEPLLQRWVERHSPKDTAETRARLVALHDGMMARLEQTRVLDPACGSGNFLYMALRALKDLEGRVRKLFEPLGLPFRDIVTPRQLFGIEKDEFAARLAYVVIWIGYLQWRYEDEGILRVNMPRKLPHDHALPEPIIQDTLTDRILCDDAIMRYDAEGKAYAPEWPEVDVIVGNPPFLGDKRMRAELTDSYVDDLRRLYTGKIPGGADLVTYWYEQARARIEARKALNLSTRVGLLSTQSIRVGANRHVLDRIKETGDIFMAWSDKEWVLTGAAVRISIVGFDDGQETEYLLNDTPVTHINSDLQNTIDATKAKLLRENLNLAYIGTQKGGDFDIPGSLAEQWIEADANNRAVVRPWMNGDDVTDIPKARHIINFNAMPLEQARQYEQPFAYVEQKVKPKRLVGRDKSSREYWWQLQRYRPALLSAIEGKSRYIATPRVAKHRIFVWLDAQVVPDSRLVVIARDDDYMFGVLHSTLHEKWAIRLASWHGVGNDPTYNAESCFQTFPFPYLPGSEDAAGLAHAAVGAAAHALHTERDAWLNPPDLLALGATSAGKALRERTLTKLYNALEQQRAGEIQSGLKANGEPNGKGGIRNGSRVSPAAQFAPRLAELHDTLDRAVLAAYGWSDLADRLHTHDGDEELLRRLLALNLMRAARA